MSSSGRNSPSLQAHYLDGRLLLQNANVSNIKCNMCPLIGISSFEEGWYCAQHSVELQIAKRWLSGRRSPSVLVYISQLGTRRGEHELCAYHGCRYYGDLIPYKQSLYCLNHLPTNRALSRSSPVTPPPPRQERTIASDPSARRHDSVVSSNNANNTKANQPMSLQQIIQRFKDNELKMDDRSFIKYMTLSVSPEYERGFINAVFSWR